MVAVHSQCIICVRRVQNINIVGCRTPTPTLIRLPPRTDDPSIIWTADLRKLGHCETSLPPPPWYCCSTQHRSKFKLLSLMRKPFRSIGFEAVGCLLHTEEATFQKVTCCWDMKTLSSIQSFPHSTEVVFSLHWNELSHFVDWLIEDRLDTKIQTLDAVGELRAYMMQYLLPIILKYVKEVIWAWRKRSSMGRRSGSRTEGRRR